jgi:nicotinate phosphoribosyltransferase
VYKLVEIDGIPVMKASSNKVTYPGRKQIWRTLVDGVVQHDQLGLITDAKPPDSQPLLQLVVKQGQRLQLPESLADLRSRTRDSVASLPPECRNINTPVSCEVTISPDLQKLAQKVSTKNR